MFATKIDRIGFVHPARGERSHSRRRAAFAALIAVAALVAAIAIAATAVSIGFARADILGTTPEIVTR